MSKILGAALITSFCVLIRLLPHAPNIAPLTALALFLGYAFAAKWALLLAPLAAIISDWFIGFYSLPVMIAVYGSYLLCALIGYAFASPTSTRSLAWYTFVGSALFFLITNGAVWLFGDWYAHTPVGLMQAYAMGLPFWRNALIADFSYGAVFFGLYRLALFYTQRAVVSVTRFPISTNP